MSKLTKPQAKAHAEAVALLAKDRLTEDERWFVLENWQESATHINSVAGAFFTPPMLARDLAVEVGGSAAFSVIDLCAGMGTLAFMAQARAWPNGLSRIVCVEQNPDYIAVGRKLLPEAEWIQADVFNLPDLGRFDFALSNPPFGSTRRSGDAPRYKGRSFEYHVIDIASDLAEHGVFIIPQGSAPFRYSGQTSYREDRSDAYEAFAKATGVELTPNCGIDCSAYQGDWHGVAPAVEIVCADFADVQAARRAASVPDQRDLFGAAA